MHKNVMKIGHVVPEIGDMVADRQTHTHTHTCHMGSHPAEVTFPPLPQPKLVLD